MKNKAIIILCIIVSVLLVSTGVLFIKFNDAKKHNKVSTPTSKVGIELPTTQIKFSEEASNRDKAYALVANYLEQYKKDTSGNQQILDYKIGIIKVRDAKDSAFECNFQYSVKPKNMNAWLVGSGKQDGEWISKNMFTEVKKSGEGYTLSETATSPNTDNSGEFK